MSVYILFEKYDIVSDCNANVIFMPLLTTAAFTRLTVAGKGKQNQNYSGYMILRTNRT